jgi:serine/threonine-protein kinase
MGEVFLARQKGPVDFSRRVVLKTLHPQFTQDPYFVKMFLNEARIAANLAHPHIVHIYELFQQGDGYVIAMEYVHGGTVLSLLRGREALGLEGVPWGPSVRIATAVCEALHFAYNEPDADGVPRRVIHRDVSPSNVLVGYDGHVKLGDFGIAKVLDLDGVTQATTIKGKYGYLTPEQIKCLPLDQRSDLFSLGTMLWEMTVGQRLFQRENEMQMMYAILEEPIPRPSERIADYPKDLERVVMKSLARTRDDRYADAQEMEHDLREVAANNGWDTGAAELARLVKEVVPEGASSGKLASGSFTQAGRRTPTSGWADSDSFASLVVIDPAARSRARSTWITIAILLAASAVFWLLIVPAI